jgi:hypothetical protein
MKYLDESLKLDRLNTMKKRARNSRDLRDMHFNLWTQHVRVEQHQSLQLGYWMEQINERFRELLDMKRRSFFHWIRGSK